MRLLFLLLFLCAVAPAQQRLFSFHATSAAFSKSLNRIVLTSSYPNQLHLYDPATGDDTILPLPALATALSVSPDGLTAAVGHEKQVTYFQLSSATLLRSLPVPGTVRQLLLAPSSAVVDLGNDNVRTLSIASGALSAPLQDIRYLGSPQLSPDGRTVFSAGYGHLDRVDLVSNVVSSSPLRHCGGILLSPDAARLYTGCGTIHQNTTDLPYAGTLATVLPVALLAGSAGFLAGGDGKQVDIFNHSDVGNVGRVTIPDFGPTLLQMQLLFNAAGTLLYAVRLGASTRPAWEVRQTGVQTFDLNARAGNCVLSASGTNDRRGGPLPTIEAEGGLLSVWLSAANFCGYAPTASDPWITIPNPRFAFGPDSLTAHVEPNPTMRERSGRIVIGGLSLVVTQKAASLMRTSARHRFSYRVVKADFSRTLNRHILASDTPNTIHIFDPVSRTDQVIPLSRRPTSLALSLDGLLAVVGHDGGISAINLKLGQVVGLFPVPLDVRALAVTPRGIVFAFPSFFFPSPSTRVSRGVPVSLNLATGKISSLPPATTYTSSAPLWPDGLTLFAAGIRWAINGSTLTPLDTYQPNICPPFWFTHGGSRVLSACGIFHSASDFLFVKSFAYDVTGADSSTALATTAVLFASRDGRLSSDSLALIPDATMVASAFPLDRYTALSTDTYFKDFPLRGRLVNWSSDNTRLHVVSDLDRTLNQAVGENQTIVESLSTQSNCVWSANPPTIATLDSPNLEISVIAPANCLWQATSSASWLRFRTANPFLGSDTVTVALLPNPDSAAREAVVTLGGTTVRVTQAGQPLVLSPSSLSLIAFPSQSTAQIITADPGLRWTAISQAPWISLFQRAGTGSSDLTFAAAPNSGGTRFGTFTVNGVVFTVAQSGGVAASNQPPVVLPPSAGSRVGLLEQRSFRFADPDGVANLAVLNILINTALDGPEACHFAYDIQASLLYLVARDGIGASTSPIGVPGVLFNGNCRIDIGAVQFTREVHSVTLTVAYQVEPTYRVGRAIYGAARDRQGNNSGWQLIGHHSLSGGFPLNPANFIPSPPSPNNPLSISYDDANSTTGNPRSTNIKFAQVLIQSTLDAHRACYIGFDHGKNLLYLIDDEGTRLLPSAIRLNGAPGGVALVENSQCRVSALGSSFTDIGSRLNLTLNITYKPAFSGPRLIYGGAQTPTANSGWQMLGFLSIP